MKKYRQEIERRRKREKKRKYQAIKRKISPLIPHNPPSKRLLMH